MAKKFDWKKEIESQLEDRFPGAKINWNGNDPTLVIPDAWAKQVDTIIYFCEELWKEAGGTVVFYPEQATYSETDIQ